MYIDIILLLGAGISALFFLFFLWEEEFNKLQTSGARTLLTILILFSVLGWVLWVYDTYQYTTYYYEMHPDDS